MQNKDMKKAFIKTILESSPLKNKPNFIDNFLKSKMQLKGKNVIKKIGVSKNKYSVLKNAISKEIADFVYNYFLNKRKVARFLFDQKYISPFTEYFGVWNDEQVPNTYSHYSDIAMETLLEIEVKPVMEKHTSLKAISNIRIC
jgi:hypothetical protein